MSIDLPKAVNSRTTLNESISLEATGIVGNSLPRRTFLARSSGLLIGLATLPALAGGGDESVSGGSLEALYREMATMGATLSNERPDTAAKLEASARSMLGIGADQTIDRSLAIQAQQVLTEPERTARELQNDQYVFVMGWLLSHSEAAAILLHASVEVAQPRSAARNRAM